MYVLINAENGKYVALPGHAKSYTTRLKSAATFATREAAEREACGNERAHSVSDLVGRE